MDVGSFQFLTSLLEFGAALNLGFAISDGFRSQPKKEFERSIQRWIKLQEAENGGITPSESEKRVALDVEVSKKKGEVAEGKRVISCRRFGVASLACSMLLSLLPLPLFAPSTNLLIGLYGVAWIFALLSLLNVAYTYKCLRDLWEAELEHITRAAALQTGTDISNRISGSR